MQLIALAIEKTKMCLWFCVMFTLLAADSLFRDKEDEDGDEYG